MSNPRAILIGGQWVHTKETMAVINPYDDSVAAEVSRAGAEEAERALAIASAATAMMAALPSHRKSAILNAAADLILKRKEEIARTIATESGKPVRDARVEADRGALTFRIAAEEASRIGGEVIPLDRNAISERRWGLTRRFPIGPVMAISPFNFPLNLVAHKVA
ncbi:MAG TPA: aldehyde dehydrogenase family protein, partial [Dissulfurispiraceae bacterium]|nr:aldehyde dehydrogenase family protein [Dissulfurispiraceae bacterium]